MRNNNGFTPNERAMDIVLTLIKGTVNGRVDFNLQKETPAFKAETLRQLGVIHNRLLAQSSLDGLPIDIT